MTIRRFVGENVRVTFVDPKMSPSADDYLTGNLAEADTVGVIVTDYEGGYPLFIPYTAIVTIEPESNLSIWEDEGTA